MQKEKLFPEKSRKRGLKRSPKDIVLVGVSALALVAATRSAHAVVAINCPVLNSIKLGNNVACANGTLVIKPTGGKSVVGCLVTDTAPQPGVCTVKHTPPTATQSVAVSFVDTSYFLSNGGNKVTIDDLLMRERGGSFSATKLTFSAAEVNAGVTIDVGGSIHFSGNQAAGVYSGGVSITADFK